MEGGIAHDTCLLASPGNGKGRPQRRRSSLRCRTADLYLGSAPGPRLASGPERCGDLRLCASLPALASSRGFGRGQLYLFLRAELINSSGSGKRPPPFGQRRIVVKKLMNIYIGPSRPEHNAVYTLQHHCLQPLRYLPLPLDVERNIVKALTNFVNVELGIGKLRKKIMQISDDRIPAHNIVRGT